MPRAHVLVAALLTLGVAAGNAAAASGPTFAPAPDPRAAPDDAPGTVSEFFTLSGGDQGGEIRFTPRGTQLPASLAAYSGATTRSGFVDGAGQVDSLAVSAMTIVSGPAVEIPLAHAAFAIAPWCARGGVDAPYNDDLGLSAPPGSSSTIMFTATVPAAFQGQTAAVQLVGDPTATTAGTVLATSPATAPNLSGVVEGVSLTVSKRKHGRVGVRGQLLSGRSGVKVQLVGTATKSSFGGPLVVTVDALAPLHKTFRQYGTATSIAGGKFSTTLVVRKAASILARTAQSGTLGAGASCPVHVG